MLHSKFQGHRSSVIWFLGIISKVFAVYEHSGNLGHCLKKGKRKVQGVPQSQTTALPRPQEEEETDNSKQAQTEQTY